MIGALDQPITLQRYTTASDGAGGVTATWANLTTNATVWASVTAKSGKEGLNEGRTTATFVTVFKIHNRDDLTELDRIVWNGENYNIRGIRRETGRQILLVIEAERGVAQ